MSRSLADLKVLELGRIVSAPWCGQVLGDLGAEVIKVERPGRGDDMRSYGPSFVRDASGRPTPESGNFLCSNRNKLSITVDISRAEGQEIIRELAGQSDILIENYKVGDLVRYGLDYSSLKQRHADLIYCSITGYGQTGPYAERPGYDAAFQGLSGMMAVTGDPDGPPQRVGVYIIDEMTGLYASIAILAALRHREAGNGGQYIDMALLDVGVAAMAPRTIEWTLEGQIPQRLGSKSPGSAPAQIFACADGHLNIQAGAEADYRKLCDVLELKELKEDARFAARHNRVINEHVLLPILEERIRSRPAKELLDQLVALGVVASPIYRADQMLADPQVVHRGMHIQVPHPVHGTVPLVGSPMRLSATPVDVYQAPPTVGQHTDEILRDRLGYSAERVSSLRSSGSI